MKQILQHLKTGLTELVDVPAPAAGAHQLLIRTTRSLISAGTERMLVGFGKATLIEKARQQPDKVRLVLDKMKTDGLLPTVEAVRHKLDQPLPLGYCAVGRVLEMGHDTRGFGAGDRVACNGHHAQIVAVPANLCARIPDNVTDEAAAFTVLGAIALQGIRLAQPTLGEAVVVIGAGLIGQLTVQLLRAHGCRVLAIDFDKNRLALASAFGAETVNLASGEDPIAAANRFSRERGVDAVLITATTESSEPVRQAAHMSRKRGRIILVGVTGLELSRADFFAKELTFQVSCSYGPGRYDPAYEEKGQDYPVGFVRWTEQRNFEAVLDMLADRRLDVGALISHRIAFEHVEQAYGLLQGDASSLGIVLEYPSIEQTPDADLRSRTTEVSPAPVARASGKAQPVVAVLGAGNYATTKLIPALREAGAALRTVGSRAGTSGAHAARKFGFAQTTTDTSAAINDPAVNVVVIATRHDTHAALACEALSAGKHVFVEKPLALTIEQLSEIRNALSGQPAPPVLMVGFNRRFAPQIVRVKSLLESVKVPKSFVMTVNAGAVPPDHWTQNPHAGGGRILGEGVHFVDLLRFLAASPIASAEAWYQDGSGTRDTATLQLAFADGSNGTVHYFANGNKAFPKERLEIFAAGRVLQLDNFRRLRGYGWPGFRKLNLWRQDKGQTACVQAFVDAVRSGGPGPIPVDELFEVSKITIELSAPRA